MITIVAKLKAQPGKEDALFAVLSNLIEVVKNEPGNKRYELYRSVDDPTTLLFYEEYVDQAAIDAHVNAPYLKAAFAEIGPMFAGRPEIRRYQELQ